MSAPRRVIPPVASSHTPPRFSDSRTFVRRNHHDRSCPVTAPRRPGREITRAIDRGIQSQAPPEQQHAATAARRRLMSTLDNNRFSHCRSFIVIHALANARRPVCPRHRRCGNRWPGQAEPSGRITRLPGSPGPEPGKPRTVLDQPATRQTSTRRCGATVRQPAGPAAQAPPHKDDSIPTRMTLYRCLRTAIGACLPGPSPLYPRPCLRVRACMGMPGRDCLPFSPDPGGQARTRRRPKCPR
jgi:hypothetical protein